MLDKYKIRVNNEAESKEAQELFKGLGYLVVNHIDREKGFIVVSKEATSPLNFDYYCSVENELTLPQLRDFVSQSKKEQGLISGADAKLAWAKGEELEFYSPDLDMWFGLNDEPFMSDVFDTRNIRIKQRTITLNVEIPAPFEPEDGDVVYFIDCDTKIGYSSDIIGQGCDPEWIQFGAWKSEDEIKQVVAALRSALTSK